MARPNIQIPKKTIDRLIALKKYGWTYGTVIEMLLDFYIARKKEEEEIGDEKNGKGSNTEVQGFEG